MYTLLPFYINKRSRIRVSKKIRKFKIASIKNLSFSPSGYTMGGVEEKLCTQSKAYSHGSQHVC